ncbi:MAG: D-alanine--D-alanine ligase [Lachnospiraceae bacterium]|nr:D-alanine--D-alanine ligase [Lachnospiraceae bacterium]
MKICILAGGISTEREVSLVSGREVYKALKERGHQVVLLDVFLGLPDADPDEVFSLDKDWAEGIPDIGEECPDLAEIKAMRMDADKYYLGPKVLKICRRADVVFLALHGAGGEDGRLQALFELNGIPYTGTDYVSSALCMDKCLSRAVMKTAGIQVPPGRELFPGEEPEWTDYPAVVKAANGGSTVGTYFVNNDEELRQAVKCASQLDVHIVIEKRIEGREFTCGLIDGNPLPPVEIIPNVGTYDYRNKYQAGCTNEICPAPISEEDTKRMQAMAVQAWKALRLSAYVRMDFMMDREGNFYCLEANTIPGMTPTSLIPQEAAAVGMNFGELCEKVIEVSMRK